MLFPKSHRPKYFAIPQYFANSTAPPSSQKVTVSERKYKACSPRHCTVCHFGRGVPFGSYQTMVHGRRSPYPSWDRAPSHLRIRHRAIPAYHASIRAYHVRIPAYHVSIPAYHVRIPEYHHHHSISRHHTSILEMPFAGK